MRQERGEDDAEHGRESDGDDRDFERQHEGSERHGGNRNSTANRAHIVQTRETSGPPMG
jgi:hypothetical protein